MPRNQNTASQRAREARRGAGTKYTLAFRTAASAAAGGSGGGRSKSFFMRELLAECSASSPWTGVHPALSAELVPNMYDSAFLGGPVPNTAVLTLGDMVSALGLSAALTLESRRGFFTANVACEGHRFQLSLDDDNAVVELCRHPACGNRPVAADYIPYCAPGHLAERAPDELTEMAFDWGAYRRTDPVRDAEDITPGHEGVLLVRTAVAQGAFASVADELVTGCFEFPDMVDQLYSGEKAQAVRDAMQREHRRLTEVAELAAAKIRKEAGGLCVCGAALLPNLEVPARFCSIRCATARQVRRSPR
ncbi:hypothetical protein [Streptomyces sp. NPDC048659]|uniref:hypothetical protein n=1 Tax=Streptomyces sp. NPDC048659 TaxID=3155489 RepID=UPI00341F031E